MRSDLVSVIIPVYNAEHYLRETLRDLVNQSYKNIEIIIIDDGSQDNSGNIIKEFLDVDNRIQSIRIDNSGPSCARNRGLDIARGRFVRFIDADDRIPNNSVEKMYQIMADNNDIDLVIGNFNLISDRFDFTGNQLQNGKVTPQQLAEVFVKHIKSFYFGVPWNKLYRRDIIEQNNIRFDENIRWSEDLLFNLQYFLCCRNTYFLNLENGVYDYYIRETGIVSSLSDTQEIRDIEKLRYKNIKNYCEQYGLVEAFEIEWKYSNLYGRLQNITKSLSNDYIWSKYKLFKKYLNDAELYPYICMKYEDTHYKVWKILKEACEKKRYFKAFMYFIIKGFCGK